MRICPYCNTKIKDKGEYWTCKCPLKYAKVGNAWNKKSKGIQIKVKDSDLLNFGLLDKLGANVGISLWNRRWGFNRKKFQKDWKKEIRKYVKKVINSENCSRRNECPDSYWEGTPWWRDSAFLPQYKNHPVRLKMLKKKNKNAK